MLYVSKNEADQVPLNWQELLNTIEQATSVIVTGDNSEPEHPFVDFPDPANRIIALPSYVGGEINVAGIKWIASFPDNINHGVPRANSVTILNSTENGIPFAIFNTTLLSIVRTSSVTGTVLRKFFEFRNEKLNVGIIGFGPIGQMHYRMLCEGFGHYINEVKIYDLRKIDYNFNVSIPTKFVDSWQEAYEDSDVFINATVTKERYVEGKPKDGALLADISLRDYKVDIFEHVKDGIIVDDWDQVCRKNTDIEWFHKEKGLQRDQVYTIADTIQDKVFGKVDANNFFFSPFGTAAYDMAIGKYYYEKVKELGLGTELED